MSNSLKIMNGVAKAMSGPRKPKTKVAMPDEPETESLKTAEPVSETQSSERENAHMKSGPSLRSPHKKAKLS